MKWRILFLGLALFALQTTTTKAHAQNVVLDLNAPVDNVAPDSVVHPYIMVEGIQVFYYYDEAGVTRYYYLTPGGQRVFYAHGWRPYRISGGARFFYDPVPYIWISGRPVYYYHQGSSIRYYTYNGSSLVYYPTTWRPFYNYGGRRTYVLPRHRYNYNTWRTYRTYNRPAYRPTYVRRHYRYNPVRRTRTYRPSRVIRRPARNYRQPSRNYRRPTRTHRQPTRTHRRGRRK
ncbi:MAG: hypothetical protein H6728_13105 [Myxococcales bacterium]|nr:hypothetical protein [Myxococcales bacterium]